MPSSWERGCVCGSRCIPTSPAGPYWYLCERGLIKVWTYKCGAGLSVEFILQYFVKSPPACAATHSPASLPPSLNSPACTHPAKKDLPKSGWGGRIPPPETSSTPGLGTGGKQVLRGLGLWVLRLAGWQGGGGGGPGGEATLRPFICLSVSKHSRPRSGQRSSHLSYVFQTLMKAGLHESRFETRKLR